MLHFSSCKICHIWWTFTFFVAFLVVFFQPFNVLPDCIQITLRLPRMTWQTEMIIIPLNHQKHYRKDMIPILLWARLELFVQLSYYFITNPVFKVGILASDRRKHSSSFCLFNSLIFCKRIQRWINGAFTIDNHQVHICTQITLALWEFP